MTSGPEHYGLAEQVADRAQHFTYDDQLFRAAEVAERPGGIPWERLWAGTVITAALLRTAAGLKEILGDEPAPVAAAVLLDAAHRVAAAYLGEQVQP